MTEKMVAEKSVAQRLGVSRNVLRAFRQDNMIEGKDYDASGRAVRLTPAGVRIVESYVFLQDAGKFVKKGCESVSALARVQRCFGINTRVMAVKLEEGAIVRVRVRNNRMFVIDQVVPIKKQAEGTVWVLDCPHPRVRGRLSYRDKNQK